MMNLSRIFFTVAASLAAIGVMLGAFGAHALKAKLAAEQLAVFETGVRYQMYHAFALIAVALLLSRTPSTAATVSGWLFMTGTVLFSGSLYLLSTRTLLGLESWTWLGPITPLGGLCFIAGWVALAVAASQR